MTSQDCPACKNASRPFLQAKDYNRRLSDEWFNYYECSSCGFIFLRPVPRDLARYYPANYYAIPRSTEELAAVADRLQTWKIDLVKRFASGGRLLEIGPAYGLFSYLAKREGFDVTAIEMDSRCCRFLRETVGITVVESADAVASLKALPTFDVIVLWQVLEHLVDPWAVLSEVAERLAPNGLLVLDTPNPEAFQFGVLGKYWTHLDAPRHVTLIPAPLLVERAARDGLRPLLVTAADRGANGFNGFGWAVTFKNFFADSSTLGRVAHLAGRVLAKLLIPIERTGFRGSTYTAAFVKDPVQ